MTFASHVLAVVLIILCSLSSLMDFVRPPQIVETMSRLRVPARSLPMLGIIKLIGVAGVIAGFASVRVGILAGLGLGLYFAIATTTHTRVKDSLKDTLPALVHFALCVLYVLVMIAR